ncbi:hypothetical protein P4H66_10235 [Paenibacillus dokdonensis]|uniref:GerMN domain-containing protein n=1 Tax=Paenibacillus dokdonensis TaxID=2567944 RepID=A0ABU6GKH0_9BACL|nr:hypothetical protein [Paenibacillus dokdonensis]MEC0240225.1 hypothetical protein [Paenibacillus dokdonensis]
MKRYYLAGFICALVILLICFSVVRDQSILSTNLNEVVDVEIYNASSPASKDLEVQMMNINEQHDVADVLNQLNKIKPNESAKPLDGNYTIILNKTDGSKIMYVYVNGVVKTSTGFKGKVKSDNIINRVWANLNYPVQNMIGNELPTLAYMD